MKLRHLIAIYIVILVALLFACHADCSITRPLINGSVLSWDSYRAYKMMVNAEDEYSFTRTQLSDVISEAKVNQRWARQTIKKLKLSRYKTHRDRVERILAYVCKKLKYKRTQPFLTVGIGSGKGNCACYSDMMYVLCKAAGYNVRFCIGYADLTCHAWNKVKIGSKWYWIDCSWYDICDETDYGFSRTLWADHKRIIEVW